MSVQESSSAFSSQSSVGSAAICVRSATPFSSQSRSTSATKNLLPIAIDLSSYGRKFGGVDCSFESSPHTTTISSSVTNAALTKFAETEITEFPPGTAGIVVYAASPEATSVPSNLSATVKLRPHATSVYDSPPPRAGRSCSVSELSPQKAMVPSLRSAAEWSKPPSICSAGAANTGGVAWPLVLKPEPTAEPSERMTRL